MTSSSVPLISHNNNSAYFDNKRNSGELKAKVATEMSQWLCRQYFSFEKNQHSVWYSDTVNSANVLGYISDPKNRFPLSPKDVLSFYTSIKYLQKKINNSRLDKYLVSKNEGEDDVAASFNIIAEKNYFAGEQTLQTIGNDLGGITRTMVNKIENIALAKYTGLYHNQHPNDLDTEELEAIEDRITEAQEKAANEFIEELRLADGDLTSFTAALRKKELLPQREEISEEEQYAILMLMGKVDSDAMLVHEMLLEDIRDMAEDNVFKTFQYFVSNALYQRKKRGRPKKDSSNNAT